MLDLPCGDFGWLSTVPLDLDYTGGDIVAALVASNEERFGGPGSRRRFLRLDLTADPLPRADVVLCRDCLVHLKNRQVVSALRNFRRSGSTYLLATTFGDSRPNVDGPLGGWRPAHLEGPPFGLGEPLRRISEAESVEDPRFSDKCLGLWRL